MTTRKTTTKNTTRRAARNVIKALNEYLRVTDGTPLMIYESVTANHVTLDDFSAMELDDTGDIVINPKEW